MLQAFIRGWLFDAGCFGLFALQGRTAQTFFSSPTFLLLFCEHFPSWGPQPATHTGAIPVVPKVDLHFLQSSAT